MDIKVILHPTDGSPDAKRALDLACDLARDHAARLLILHAQRQHGLEAMPEEMKGYERLEHVRVTEADLLHEAARTIVETAAREARDRGLADVDTLVVEGDPSRAILDTAKQKKADLIVMGSRGLGDLKGLLLGSVSHKVAQSAPCSCLTVR